jgi:hypothetical protein
MADDWGNDPLVTPDKPKKAAADSHDDWGNDKLITPTSRMMASQLDQPAPKPSTPTIEKPATRSTLEGIGTGMWDPVQGGAQLLSHIVPAPVEQAVNHANNWLADKTGLVAKLPEGTNTMTGLVRGTALGQAPGQTAMDVQTAQREAAIQASRGADAGSMDWARLTGNIASPVNYLAPGVMGGASAAARLGGAALASGTMAALNPVAEPGNYWAEKGKQTAEGAAMGYVGGEVGERVANALAPTFQGAVRRLLDAGVSLTPGQMAGGLAKRSEDTLNSLPILGHVMDAANRRSIESFNIAAINEALAPIGVALPRGTQAGYEAIRAGQDALGDAYGRLLPNVSLTLDQPFMQRIGQIRQLASELPADNARQFENILQNRVAGRTAQTGGVLDGKMLKDIESELSQLSSGFRGSQMAGERDLGQRLHDVNDAIRETLERQNPAQRAELRAINSAYGRFADVENAAAARPTALGVFSPGDLLRGANKGETRRVRAAGTAPMADLAQAAQEVLPNKIPDSGTAQRVSMIEAALGLVGILGGHPGAVAGGAAAALPYSRVGMNALNAWAAPAGATRNALAQGIRQSTPYLAPAAAGMSVVPQPGQ